MFCVRATNYSLGWVVCVWEGINVLMIKCVLRDMILGLWINVLMIIWGKSFLDHWGENEDIYLLYFYRRIWWLNGLFVCEMIRFGTIDWFHFCENWIARTHQDMCFVPWIYHMESPSKWSISFVMMTWW